MGLFFGGLAQFVGGLLEYPRRNTFGLVAFCCYGGFWMGLSIMEVLVAGGVLPAPPREAVAMFLSLWGIVTFLLWLCSLHLTLVTSGLLLTLSILFWALAAGEYHPAVQQGAGGFGFFVALLAFYDATAALMQEMYGCPILARTCADVPTVPLKPLWDRLALGAHGGSHAKLANRSLTAKAAIAPVPLRPAPRRAPVPSTRVAQTVAASAEAASTARIIVQGRNMEVTPSMKDYAIQKVAKAVHNFEGAVKEVDIVEVTVFTLRHGVVRVEDEEEDIYAAMDLVTDKLKRKLSKLKEKAVQKSNWPGRGGSKGGAHLGNVLDTEVPELPTDRVASLPPEVVREKLLPLAPMSVEEAVEQLENVGHDFFVFADAADGGVKVLYRRRSHGYGIIVPQA
eukprot:scaffold10.g2371.t1